MRQEQSFSRSSGLFLGQPSVAATTGGHSKPWTGLRNPAARLPRQAVLGLILIVALVAFEIFNFDTTRYALTNLLGEVSFMGLGWAVILAIAFCAIDFAGLARMFTPERGRQEPKEVWYLMGAWLLGATMNAIMTWWAISLTLLNHEFGNEVLGREQLLTYVPVFVAVLVWLTRILFIGAISVAGDHLFSGDSQVAGNQIGDRTASQAQMNQARMQQKSQVGPGGETPSRTVPVRAPEPVTMQRPPRPAYSGQPVPVAARGRRR